MISLTTDEFDSLTDPPAHQLRVDDLGVVVVELDDQPPHVALVVECVNLDVDHPPFRMLLRLSPILTADLLVVLEAAMSHFIDPSVIDHPDI